MNQYEFWFRLRNVPKEDKPLFVCVYHELWRGDMNREELAEVLGVDTEEINRVINGLVECKLLLAEWNEELKGFDIEWVSGDPWSDGGE